MRAIRRTRNAALAASTFFSGGTGIAAPVPEKRTTGRMVAFKRYSGEGFTCHEVQSPSIDSFRVFYWPISIVKNRHKLS